MAKSLKRFKKPKKVNLMQAEVLPAEDETSDMPTVISNDVASLGPQSLKLLDQLEKAGYTAIASKLRELQVTEGLEALDPMVKRLGAIEAHIDKLLAFGHPIDVDELQRLLNMAVQAYQARAKGLLLPYGTVSPRTALQGNRGPQGVNVAIGIGTGVSPRPK